MFRWKVFESSAHKLLPASNHFIYIVYWCRIRAKLLKKRTKNGTRALINELFLPKGTETTKINVENPCCLCIFFFVKVTVGWRHVYASVDDDITTTLTRSANENSDYILKPNQNPRKKYQWCCKNTHHFCLELLQCPKRKQWKIRAAKTYSGLEVEKETSESAIGKNEYFTENPSN